MTVSHTVQELWPEHEFWPMAENSNMEKARVVILDLDCLIKFNVCVQFHGNIPRG